MKKNLAFLLIGFMLAYPASALAETVVSMIGRQIEGQFPLYIDGKKSEKDAIVVEGTSYIPVRAAGELFGYDIGFLDSEVKLTKREKTIQEKIDDANKSIMSSQASIEKFMKDDPEAFKGSEFEQVLLDRIAKQRAIIAELEAQLAETTE